MNEATQPAIEPVTDEDTRVATQSYFINMKQILEQDRRRVAERQARSYKREKDCATADDWRHRAYHLEAEWARCSQQCAVMQGERDAARAEVAAHRKHDVLRCDALMKAEAEVAALKAACAQKDAALRAAGVDDPDTLRNSCEMCECDGAECPASCWVKLGNAALSDTAGAGWIDATGAVEVDIVLCHANDPDGHSEMLDPPLFPADWAGSRVLIVRKP